MLAEFTEKRHEVHESDNRNITKIYTKGHEKDTKKSNDIILDAAEGSSVEEKLLLYF